MGKILYVEDDAGVSRMVARLLGREGHDVLVVDTIERATESQTTQQFDLVICGGSQADYAARLLCESPPQKAMIYASRASSERPGVPFCVKPGIEDLPLAVAEALK